MKVAVTGCNGLIGSRVVLQGLKQGHTVVGIDITDQQAVEPLGEDQDLNVAYAERFRFHKANLTVYEEAIAALQGCEAVIHLAGKVIISKSF